MILNLRHIQYELMRLRFTAHNFVLNMTDYAGALYSVEGDFRYLKLYIAKNDAENLPATVTMDCYGFGESYCFARTLQCST